MLTNEKYTGDCLFQKTYSDLRFKRHVNHGERDQFMITDHHEPIISHEDFDAVAQALAQRAEAKSIKKSDPKYQNRYPFSGKLVCGYCGSKYKRHINNTGTVKYPVWTCKEHLENKNQCPTLFIRECDLELAFTTMVNKLIFAEKEILQELMTAVQADTQKDVLMRIHEIDEALEKNTERQQTLVTVMATGYVEPDLFAQESNELNAEGAALTKEKERLVNEISDGAHQLKELADLLNYAHSSEPSESFNGDLVQRFLEKATVNNRKEITFHLKCGLSFTEREALTWLSNRRKKDDEIIPAPVQFRMAEPAQLLDDPYQQAEYLYTLIERED